MRNPWFAWCLVAHPTQIMAQNLFNAICFTHSGQSDTHCLIQEPWAFIICFEHSLMFDTDGICIAHSGTSDAHYCWIHKSFVYNHLRLVPQTVRRKSSFYPFVWLFESDLCLHSMQIICSCTFALVFLLFDANRETQIYHFSTSGTQAPFTNYSSNSTSLDYIRSTKSSKLTKLNILRKKSQEKFNCEWLPKLNSSMIEYITILGTSTINLNFWLS